MDFRDIYVYPNGGCASVALRILKDLVEYDIDVKFVDDSLESTSLHVLKDEILDSGLPVLLLGGDCYDNLREKCDKFGIDAINGISLVANLLSNKINEYISGGGGEFELLDSNTLYIKNNYLLEHAYMFHNFFISYSDNDDMQKVLDSLVAYCSNIKSKIDLVCDFINDDRILLTFSSDFLSISKKFTEDTPLFWYFGTVEWYEKNKHLLEGNFKNIICNWAILDFFINNTALLGGNALPKLRDDKRSIYGAGHSMAEAFSFASLKESKKYLDKRVYNSFCAFSNFIAISKDSKNAFDLMFSEVGLDIEVVCGGYPRFDNRFKIQSDIKCEFDQYLFVPRLSKPYELVNLIQYLLDNNKRVVFRRHGAYFNYTKWQGMNDPYLILNSFLEDSNFSFDDEVNITNEILNKSIVITDNSSVAYSAPLVSLKPCILYSPQKK